MGQVTTGYAAAIISAADQLRQQADCLWHRLMEHTAAEDDLLHEIQATLTGLTEAHAAFQGAIRGTAEILK